MSENNVSKTKGMAPEIWPEADTSTLFSAPIYSFTALFSYSDGKDILHKCGKTILMWLQTKQQMQNLRR